MADRFLHSNKRRANPRKMNASHQKTKQIVLSESANRKPDVSNDLII